MKKQNYPQLINQQKFFLRYQSQGFNANDINIYQDYINKNSKRFNQEEIKKINLFFSLIINQTKISHSFGESFYSLYVPSNLTKTPGNITFSIEEINHNIKELEKLIDSTNDFIAIIKKSLTINDKKSLLGLTEKEEKISEKIKELETNKNNYTKETFFFAHKELKSDIHKNLISLYNEQNEINQQIFSHYYAKIKNLKNPFKKHPEIFNQIKNLKYQEQEVVEDDEAISYVIMGEDGKFYPNSKNDTWTELSKAKLFSSPQKAEMFLKMKNIGNYAIIKVKINYLSVVNKNINPKKLDEMIAAQDKRNIDQQLGFKNSKAIKNKL